MVNVPIIGMSLGAVLLALAVLSTKIVRDLIGKLKIGSLNLGAVINIPGGLGARLFRIIPVKAIQNLYRA